MTRKHAFSQSIRLMSLTAVLSIAAGVTGQHALAATKPSFDCARAKSVAEKQICADPELAEQDTLIAKNYAAALKRLDAGARKALMDDQRDFAEARDRMAEFNDGKAKADQNFDVGEMMRDRATFLANIRPAPAKFSGTWKNLRGQIKITPVDGDQLDVAADTGDPVSGSAACDIEDTVPAAKMLTIVDKDDNNKPTGLEFTFRREGDRLIAEESATGDSDVQSPSCGANGHVDGTFFFTAGK